MEANSDLQLAFRSSIAEQGVYICSSNQAYIRVRPSFDIFDSHKKAKSGPSGYSSLRDLLHIKREIQQTQKAKRLAYQRCTIKLTPSKLCYGTTGATQLCILLQSLTIVNICRDEPALCELAGFFKVLIFPGT